MTVFEEQALFNTHDPSLDVNGTPELTAVLIGVILGAIPVIGGLPVNLTTVLREEGRTGTSGRRARMIRRVLVTAQVAIAFVLLIGAGLLFASFRRVLAVDPGFNPDGVLTASLTLPQSRYADNEAVRRFTNDVLQTLRSIPGVVTAGATTQIPFSDDFTQDVLFPEGYRLNPGDSLTAMYHSYVTVGYFETMRMRLVSGRFFDERDTLNAPNVVIVDERLARRYWPGIDPVGRRMYEPTDATDLLAITEKTQWFTVIGVVNEVKLRGLVEGVGETGAYYTPLALSPQRSLILTLRTPAPPIVADQRRSGTARPVGSRATCL